MKKINKILIIALVSLTALPLSANALFIDEEFLNELENIEELEGTNNGQAQITNNISVSASTGGNSAVGGEIIEGKEKAEIKVETIINGQVIDPIDIESDEGEASVKSQINASDENIQVQREIKVGSETINEDYEINAESPAEAVVAKPQVKAEETIETIAAEPAEEISEENNSPEQGADVEQSEKREKIFEKPLAVLSDLLADIINNFKSFFQSVFNIF